HDDLGFVGQAEAHHHLLMCEHCRNGALTERLLDEEETWDPSGTPEAARTVGRAVEVLQERLLVARADQEKAEALCHELLAEPLPRQVARVAGGRRSASPAAAHRLLALADAGIADDPRRAEHLSELAATIAERLPRPWSGLEREALL